MAEGREVNTEGEGTKLFDKTSRNLIIFYLTKYAQYI